MSLAHSTNPYRSIPSLGLIAIMSLGLTACATTEQQRQLDLQQDIDTCISFGAPYGSPAHSQCMLVQQQRRDMETINALEQARIASEISRNTQDTIASRDRP